MASNSQPAGLQWQVTFQGRTMDVAHCQRDVLIIVSSESLQGDDIVPRRDVELTQEDIEKLQRLNLPGPVEQWKDDASIMKARCELDKQYYGSVTVKRGETKQSILKACEIMMKSTTKAGVDIVYFGPGKRNTGDWCFADGFITFRDLAELYCSYFKGCILSIDTDCSYSGHWVKELLKFVDEQGVKPCGHSARDKGLLINVGASCKHNEIPYRLLYAIKSFTNDKNKGTLVGKENHFEVAEEQHLSSIDPTRLRCSEKSIKESCTLLPDQTWQHLEEGKRLCLVGRKDDRGRPIWYYILLEDDEETIKNFHERIGSEIFNAAEYGQVLKSGLGEGPPNDIKDWFERRYC